MSNETLTFKCPELASYQGGVAEAIVQLQDNVPAGIICNAYLPKDGICKIKRDSRFHQNQYSEKSENYNATSKEVERQIAIAQGLPQRGAGEFSSRDLNAINSRVIAEIERLRAEREKQIALNIRCVIARGFQLLPKTGETQ